MSKTTTATLAHADWCRAERIEHTQHAEHGLTTTHCLDCGAHEVADRTGKPLTLPTVTGGLAGGRPGAMWDVSMENAPAGGGAL